MQKNDIIQVFDLLNDDLDYLDSDKDFNTIQILQRRLGN